MYSIVIRLHVHAFYSTGNKKRLGYEEIETDENANNMDNGKTMALDNEMYQAGGKFNVLSAWPYKYE